MTDLHTHPTTRGHELAATQHRRLNSSTWQFIRHYAEMVAVMFLGMGVLGVPAGWALGALGSSWSRLNTDAPALMLLGMAATMTIPMVAWMRFRGHGWRANTEMTASMVLPTFDAMNIGTALVVEHVAMLLGMLAAMLLRLDEYTHHHHHGHAGHELAAA